MKPSTVDATREGNIFGNKLYQKRAFRALPILVRQAKARQPIFYSDLADELGMPNPRNLNYVLGKIGHEMKLLNRRKIVPDVPAIQCVVINRATGLPGEGFHGFIRDQKKFAKLNAEGKRAVLKEMLSDVFAFQDWDEVLAYYGMQPASPVNSTGSIDRASKRTRYGRGGGGEGEEHRRLKEAIHRNPGKLDIVEVFRRNEKKMERALPSQDTMDVSLMNDRDWIGIEVKGRSANETEVIRGLFQCIKYEALMFAELKSRQLDLRVRTILALGGEFPDNLIGLRNTLGVEVIDRLQRR